MRYKILLIAIMIIAAILTYFLYKQINVPAPVLQAEPLKTRISLIGTVQETRQVTIGSQDYIDKYIDWQFREINNTHWTADFSFIEPFFSDLRKCLNNPSDTTCWEYIQNTYLPDYNLNKIRTDLLNLENYPLRNLTAGISFSNFQIDLTSGTGSFLINFPEGFKEDEQAILGFGSTKISTTSSLSPFYPNGKSICRTTNRIHVVYPSTTVRYTNSTDGITWGSSIQLDGSQGSDNPNVNIFVECSGNNVFVSWHDNTGGHRYMNSSDEGVTWTSNATGGMAPRLTAMPYSSSSTPISSAMFMPNTNNIFLASWNQSVVGVRVLNTSTYTGASDPTNTSTTIFAPVSSNKHPPAIYINSSGAIFVAILSGNDNDLYFNFSSDEGTTWTGSKVATGSFTYPDIVQMNRTIFISSHTSNNDDVWIFNSTNNGVTWTATRVDTIGSGTARVNNPALASDGVNLYIFWRQNNTDQNWDIKYRKWNASYGWDSVIDWQDVNSSLAPNPNPKRGNSSNLIEVVWANRTATSGSIDVMYDFINVTIPLDTTLPTWINNATNSTLASTWVNHSVVLTDETALDYYIFEFDNGTSTLTNISTVDISGAQVTANQTVLINSTAGSSIRWRYYFNDTSNNWNSTDLFSYRTTTQIIHAPAVSLGTSSVTDPLGSSQKATCRTANRIHAVWRSSGVARYTNSTDGVTWNTAIDLSGTTTYDNPDVPLAIACENNNVVVMWGGEPGASAALFYRNSSNEGGTWSSLINDRALVYYNFTTTASANIKFDTLLLNGNLWAGFQERENDKANMTNTTSIGSDLPTITNILLKPFSAGAGAAGQIALATNSTSIFTVYHDESDDDLYFNRTDDYGATWTGSKVYTGTMSRPDLTIFNGILYATFVDTNDIYVINSTDYGSTWGTAVKIYDDVVTINQSTDPSITNTSNNLYVFYARNTTSTDNRWGVAYKMWNISSGWSSEIIFDETNSSSTTLPNINSMNGTAVDILFFNNSNDNIYYSVINEVPPDTTKPTWSNSQTNSTLAGSWVNHSVVLSDNADLDYYIFEFSNGTNDGSTTVQVTASADDWGYRINNCNPATLDQNSSTGTTFSIGRSGGSCYEGQALFPNVAIPDGITIDDVRVEINITSIGGNTNNKTATELHFENSSEPKPYNATNWQSRNRNRTANFVWFNITKDVNSTGMYNSSNMKDVFQEIYNLYSYASGRNVSVIFLLNISTADTANYFINTYDGNPATAPKLYITYKGAKNISTVDISGTTITANQTVLINSTVGSTIRWRYYFNDTGNNWNSTSLFSYVIHPTINISSSSVALSPYTMHPIVQTDDAVYHVFVQNGTGGLRWYTSADYGLTWNDVGQVNSNSTVYADARLRTDNEFYIVYANASQTATGGTTHNVYFRLFNKTGVSWQLSDMNAEQVIISGSSTYGYAYATLELDANRIWTAFRTYNGSQYYAQVMYSSGFSSSPTWTSSANLTPSTTSTLNGVSIMARWTGGNLTDNRIAIFYNNYTSSDNTRVNWVWRNDSDSLTTWSTPEIPGQEIVPPAGFQFIAVGSGDDYVHHLWHPNTRWDWRNDTTWRTMDGGITTGDFGSPTYANGRVYWFMIETTGGDNITVRNDTRPYNSPTGTSRLLVRDSLTENYVKTPIVAKDAIVYAWRRGSASPFEIKANRIDVASPRWSNNATNSTAAGLPVLHSVKWNDMNLSYYIFEFDNGTGIFTNDTAVAFTPGTERWSNVTKIINSTVGTTIRWRVYSNDTINNWNSTGLFSYTTSNAPPTIVNQQSYANWTTSSGFNITATATDVNGLTDLSSCTLFHRRQYDTIWWNITNNKTGVYNSANGNCTSNVSTSERNQIVWSRDIYTGTVGIQLIVVNETEGIVYVVDSNNGIYKINATNGTVIASTDLSGYGASGLSQDADFLYFGDAQTNRLRRVNKSLDTGMGSNNDASDFGSDANKVSTSLDAGFAYVGDEGYNLTKVNKTNFTDIRWQVDFGVGTINDIDNNQTGEWVYTCDSYDIIKKINKTDNATSWSVDKGSNECYSIKLDLYDTNGTTNLLWTGDGNYILYLINETSGATIWSRDFGVGVIYDIVVDDDFVYTFDNTGKVMKINKTDKTSVWNFTISTEDWYGGDMDTSYIYTYDNNNAQVLKLTKDFGNYTALENITTKMRFNDTANAMVETSEAWNIMPDFVPPTWSNNQSSYPSQYSPTLSIFNITWDDNAHVSTSLIEINYSGAVNYTMTKFANNVYNFNLTLPAGSFYWKSYANDTSNNWNVSDTWNFTINQNSTNPINIFFINSTGTYQNQNITIDYGESTTANATMVYSNAGTASLFEDNSSVTNPRTITLSAGNHSYKGNTSGNTNYTANGTGATYYITVKSVAYAISINLNVTQVWWNDSINLSGYATSTGSPFSGWIQVNRSNDTVTMCNITTSNGYYSCVFYAPLEIGNYNYTSYMLSQTGSTLVGNSTILTVMLSYGSEYPGKNVGVYEAPVIIQELSGKIKIVWVKVKTWFNR